MHLLGLIPERWLRVLGLTGFYYLRIGKNIFRIFVKDDSKGCSDHFPILLEGGIFRGTVGYSVLRTRGQRQMALWIERDPGGNPTLFELSDCK